MWLYGFETQVRILISHLLFYRNPGSPPSWKQQETALMTLSISLQRLAPVATSCCPAWAARFAERPWETFWGMSWGSSMPCVAAVHRTSAAAFTASSRPLSRHQKKTTTRPHLPQPLSREGQTLNKNPQNCLSQLLHASDPRIWAPGNVKHILTLTQAAKDDHKSKSATVNSRP